MPNGTTWLSAGNPRSLCGVRIFWGFLQFIALGMNFLVMEFWKLIFFPSRSCLSLVPSTHMEMGDVSSLNYNCTLWRVLSNHNGGESYLDCRSVGRKWSWASRPESNWLLIGTRLILKILDFPFLGAGKLAFQGSRTWVPSSLGLCRLLALCTEQYVPRAPSRWCAWVSTLTALCFQSWGTDGRGKPENALQSSLN